MSWLNKVCVNIVPFNVDSDLDEVDIDRYDMMDQADEAFNSSGIRSNRNKEYTHMAIEDGRVIGAVSSSWENGSEGLVYSFDIAVKPEYRGPAMVGLRLIDEAVREYEYTKNNFSEPTVMRLWVVNPKLVPVLEKKYKFEIESDHGSGGVHMIRY